MLRTTDLHHLVDASQRLYSSSFLSEPADPETSVEKMKVGWSRIVIEWCGLLSMYCIYEYVELCCFLRWVGHVALLHSLTILLRPEILGATLV